MANSLIEAAKRRAEGEKKREERLIMEVLGFVRSDEGRDYIWEKLRLLMGRKLFYLTDQFRDRFTEAVVINPECLGEGLPQLVLFRYASGKLGLSFARLGSPDSASDMGADTILLIDEDTSVAARLFSPDRKEEIEEYKAGLIRLHEQLMQELG